MLNSRQIEALHYCLAEDLEYHFGQSELAPKFVQTVLECIAKHSSNPST